MMNEVHMDNLANQSHRRWNPLTSSWVLCSPHRAKRPWLGQQENIPKAVKKQHDATCFLCPSNMRSDGQSRNPAYASTFVFPNDFPAVQGEATSEENSATERRSPSISELFQAESVRGQCHVVCFSPRHDLTMAEMTIDEIVLVIDTWVDEYMRLGTLDYIDYVQIFENKGEAMGCSNPHPHGQIWGTSNIPEEPSKELRSMRAYRQSHGTCLLCDYAAAEVSNAIRVVHANPSFLCIVPFWAVWPYEIMIVSKRHITALPELSGNERRDLADALRNVTCRYDNLFKTSFPYSMGIHQAPTDGGQTAGELHLHLHFYPPLLRSATVKKFLVGFEMLAEPQRDITAEEAAERLRQCSEVHYLSGHERNG
ncbi:galactose-1-phosphate uridylyltransferase [Gaertneriomyces semiglobifer]|nr:galactose-1-phosphate uridylyltransferase [Gaertneriomyces semiglobifer]